VADLLVSVAVPVPALGLLTYRVPPGVVMPVAGARVVVPLGPRKLTGVIVGHVSAADVSFTLKDIVQVLDDGAFVPPDVVSLTQWVSDYYLAGPGAALAVALPPHGLTNHVDRFKTVRVVTLTAAGMDAADRMRAHPRCAGDERDSDGPTLGTKQKQAVQLLRAAPDGMSAPDLAERGIAAASVTRLQAMGYVTIRQDRVDRDPFEHAVGAHTPDSGGARRPLTSEQQAAMDQLTPLAAARAFQVALVHGVTGSGKTEVYLRLADAVRQGGRGVLMLVPEIALTPQVAALFRARFGTAVAIQHSGLSDGERHDQWHRIRRGEVDVVIGTRSAVFAPLANPGLIIVDEEHDTSYKQDETPRYHGRDVAIMRGKFAKALVVIGSATPTLESYNNALAGRYTLVTLNRRVLDRPMAQVQVVNMREEIAEAGAEVVLSRALTHAIAARLAAGQQSLILLNRRGFATSVLCRQCGASLECPNCSVTLTVHGGHSLPGRSAERDGWRGRCHYCNFTKLVPKACEKCAAPYMERIGFGTERVEAEVRAAFPAARVTRVDRDTVRRKGSLVEMLEQVARREVDVLIGTQMIAKGHDFPECTLVGVISADVGLGLADFRSAERTFQLLTQVAGRAGRGEQPGQAIIQSLVPEHYSVRLACDQDYRAFYEKEVEFRRAMRYPPQVAMVNVVVRDKTFDAAMASARLLAAALSGRQGYVVLGPAPAPLTKLRGEHRVQLFLKGTSRKAMREGMQLALTRVAKLAKTIAVDVDPLTML
jgi:primosomal protein N' (replication factor Y)